jgi:tetratricopeptide (TPR) repeat protein
MGKPLDERAQPFLSLCMIVKNERENLPRCLASSKLYVDEMVVVDTGSEDGTPEIAAEQGAIVGGFEWCNDFAAARNYSLSLASGKWILVLDADEQLVVSSDTFRQQLATQQEILAYTLPLIEARETTSLTLPKLVRLFRNLPELRYTGRFHEHLEYRGKRLTSEAIAHLDCLQLLHYGTTPSELSQENIHRNIPILEAARREEGLSLMLLYCLASMYIDTQQPEKAQECYAEACDRLTPNLLENIPPSEFEFVPSLLFALGSQFLQQEDYETARLLCQRGLDWCPTFPPLNYLTAMLLKLLGFPLGAVAYLEYCLALGQKDEYYKGEPFEQNFMTVYPACELGALYLELGRRDDAIHAFELALSFDPNSEVIQHNLAQIQIKD